MSISFMLSYVALVLIAEVLTLEKSMSRREAQVSFCVPTTCQAVDTDRSGEQNR